MKTNVIIQGNALEELKKLPEKSINMCMTSPPYWALRDYGIEEQLGLEPTFDEYINKLCNIFDEVKRVLRDDGTCWVNIGDTYSGGGGWTGIPEDWESISTKSKQKRFDNPSKKTKLPDKTLTMIPFRFAIEMVNRGWILRNTIIWHKRNCMPSSAKDRFTVDFEYLFFFSKKKNYYFEAQYEKASEVSIERYKYGWDGNTNRDYVSGPQNHLNKHLGKEENRQKLIEQGRNKRTVWTINPKPFSEAHFAVYPEELCETPIKAGCPVGGIVLDPFFGTGTTGVVALKQSKKFIGIELNKKYIEIAKKRLKPYLEQRKLV